MQHPHEKKEYQRTLSTIELIAKKVSFGWKLLSISEKRSIKIYEEEEIDSKIVGFREGRK